ncbi:MAG TPA: YheC/YheD family protein [Symbiobacteriaceae bacterium]|nr:YheC/YheD family protein [Symbiobacteriaceae bacterium]
MDRSQVLSRTETRGPLIGLLISEAKLRRVLGGQGDRVYCRYARYAREVGASLVFFAAPGLDEESRTVHGFHHRCDLNSPCSWEPVNVPVPFVVYDRCFGLAARGEALSVREAGRRLLFTVVNNPAKVTKLMTFEALSMSLDLAGYLPYTTALTPESLAEALVRYDDLYLKPDYLYKGKGVYRLTRLAGNWLLQHRSDEGNETEQLLPGREAEVLGPLLQAEARYLIQEGLDLATYQGNRFDFRSLVQKDQRGRWVMTGLVARIAAAGSVITSPRSGGQVASAERALRSHFGTRAPALVEEIARVSILLSGEAERHFGTCAEFGLDLGVTRDGRIKLIEINGKPLRVSLARLSDPLISERIDRYPIHFAAYVASGALEQARLPATDAPLVGVLLGSLAKLMEPGPWAARYLRMMQEGRSAGTVPFVFTAPDINLAEGVVHARVERHGEWIREEIPLPEVIYHRAIYSAPGLRKAVRATLKQMSLHRGTILLNKLGSFTKLQVHQALTFFPSQAALSPETRPFTGPQDLEEMLARHPAVFVKANDGSHGTEVVRITALPSGWEVRGKIGGRTAAETFDSLPQVQDFLALTTAGRLWIVQQGIALPQVDGRICDLRVILQKDGTGEWQTPLILLRWGRAGSVAANMSQGGEPCLPEAFRQRMGARASVFRHVEPIAQAAALQAAHALETRFGLLGEIGVDVAVDEDGRAWILEANTKPVHPLIEGLPVPLERYPFSYAGYLAGRARAALRTP